jgi:Leucine-rich repeat (LRR) protein
LLYFHSGMNYGDTFSTARVGAVAKTAPSTSEPDHFGLSDSYLYPTQDTGSFDGDDDHYHHHHHRYQRTSRRKWMYYTLLGVLVVIGVALGIAVAVERGNNNSGSPSSQSSNQGGTHAAPSGNNDKNNDSGVPRSPVYEILQPFALRGGAEFNNHDSYQFKALQYVEAHAVAHNTTSTTNAQSALFTDSRIVQRYALACIYYATYQVPTTWTGYRFASRSLLPWQNSTGWLNEQFPDECDGWFGIRCDTQTRQVVELDFASNVLTGTMPPETALLRALQILDLYNNHVYNVGAAGNDWLGNLTNLEQLFLGKSPFVTIDEGIPTALSRLSKLQDLDVSYTLYRGALQPSLFRNWPDLVYLKMGGNSYNSSLPLAQANLPSLKYLYAEYTDLHGTLRNLFVKAPSLVEVWMDRNPRLSGSLPTNMGNDAPGLASVSFTHCNLTGTIPSSLASIPGLQQVWLYDNALRGSVPTEFGALLGLERLQMEQNQLTGTMPAILCQQVAPLGRLQHLTVDCEEIGGVPPEVKCDESCCSCCGPSCITNDANMGVR